MTQLIINIQKHPSSHIHKYCSLTAFNIHNIRIINCTLLPIIIISHRSINFEQKCRRVVSLSVNELSQKMCQRIVLSMSCLDFPGRVTINPTSKQKRFWSFIKSLRKVVVWLPLKKTARCMQIQRTKLTSLTGSMNWSTQRKIPTLNVPSPSGQPYQPMKEITVTEHGVCKLLLKINPRKACGPDTIYARILKDLADELAPLLTSIYQKSFDCGEVPEDWRSANITLVFKKGD